MQIVIRMNSEQCTKKCLFASHLGLADFSVGLAQPHPQSSLASFDVMSPVRRARLGCLARNSKSKMVERGQVSNLSQKKKGNHISFLPSTMILRCLEGMYVTCTSEYSLILVAKGGLSLSNVWAFLPFWAWSSRYPAQFQASSSHLDRGYWPGHEAGAIEVYSSLFWTILFSDEVGALRKAFMLLTQ